jgi:hypothetical protein
MLPAAVAAVYVADLFAPWTRSCIRLQGILAPFCHDSHGWSGLAGMAGVFAVIVAAWQLLRWVRGGEPSPARDRMVVAVLSLAALALTIAEVLLDIHVLAWGAWVGLGVAVALAVVAIGQLRSVMASPEENVPD